MDTLFASYKFHYDPRRTEIAKRHTNRRDVLFFSRGDRGFLVLPNTPLEEIKEKLEYALRHS
jgi:hypothetical protein